MNSGYGFSSHTPSKNGCTPAIEPNTPIFQRICLGPSLISLTWPDDQVSVVKLILDKLYQDGMI